MGPCSTHPKHDRMIELKNEEKDRAAEPQSHRAAEKCMDA
jgi:hypothetical protein